MKPNKEEPNNEFWTIWARNWDAFGNHSANVLALDVQKEANG